MTFDPERSSLGGLVLLEGGRGHSEDVVELLEGTLLGFRHEQEDHDESEHVEATKIVETSALIRERE